MELLIFVLIFMIYGILVKSQKKNDKLQFNEFLYNKSSESKGIIKWQCERRDLKCYVTISSKPDGEITQLPVSEHCHSANEERCRAAKRKDDIINRALERLDETPSKILNESLTKEDAGVLPTEHCLKRSIRYARRKLRPLESLNASELEVNGNWLNTLDGKRFYFGKVNVREDVAYVFTTDDNLRYLSVRYRNTCTQYIGNKFYLYIDLQIDSIPISCIYNSFIEFIRMIN
jgi:hypothetical protein